MLPSIDTRYIAQQFPMFVQGLQMTLTVATCGMLGAVVWGFFLLWPRTTRFRPVVLVVSGYIELVRNSPLLVQIYVLYFALPHLGVWISAFWCGVLAIASQHGAFFCETCRGGVQSVSEGQRLAGQAIGMTRFQVTRLIVLPQALLKVWPSITNQFVILIKDTSLVSGIGVIEMTLMAKLSVERSAATFEIFIVIAVMYLIITTCFGGVSRLLEQSVRRRIG